MLLWLAVVGPLGYLLVGMMFDLIFFYNNAGKWDRSDLGVTLLWPLFVLKMLAKLPAFFGTSLAGGFRKLRTF